MFHCGRPPCTSFHSSPGLSLVQIQLLWPFVLLSFCLSHSIGVILIQMDLSRNKTKPRLHTNHLSPGCRAGTSLSEAPTTSLQILNPVSLKQDKAHFKDSSENLLFYILLTSEQTGVCRKTSKCSFYISNLQPPAFICFLLLKSKKGKKEGWEHGKRNLNPHKLFEGIFLF